METHHTNIAVRIRERRLEGFVVITAVRESLSS